MCTEASLRALKGLREETYVNSPPPTEHSEERTAELIRSSHAHT